MVKKTLDKLKKICEPHGVEINYFKEPETTRVPLGHSVYFFAPEGIHWNASGCNAVAFHKSSLELDYSSKEPLKGIIPFIKEEIKEGFYKSEEGEE